MDESIGNGIGHEWSASSKEAYIDKVEIVGYEIMHTHSDLFGFVDAGPSSLSDHDGHII